MAGGASAPAMWEFEKKQMTAQINLLSTQLETETSSRIEAQVYNIYEFNIAIVSHISVHETSLIVFLILGSSATLVNTEQTVTQSCTRIDITATENTAATTITTPADGGNRWTAKHQF